MAPRRRCPVCRSRQWHKEPSSGLIACNEGHILQGYRNETTESQEMTTHALRKRALKSGRETKSGAEKLGRSNPKLHHGQRGTYLYFQCLQLIFRKQIAALTQLWRLPAEFEQVCRDVWALNLTLLPQQIQPEPYYYAHGENTDQKEDDEIAPPAKDEERDGDATSDDENIAAALQADSSSEEDEDEEAPPKAESSKRRDKSRYRSMGSTIAVLALACWQLRIPIMYSDLVRVIDAYDLPYLDAVKYLPKSMVVHLTKENAWALSMQRPPRIQVLHRLTARLAKKMYEGYSVLTPELNAAPLLWRVTKAFGGTPTLYELTKHLSRILELPLTVSYALSPVLERSKQRDPDHHAYDYVPPEVGFVAGTIMVLKMVYGLDGIERVPCDPGDPAAAFPKIDEYIRLIREMEAQEGQSREALFGTESNMLAGNLSEEMLDEYVNFCEKALLGDEEDGMIRKFFPIQRGDQQREAPKNGESVQAPYGPLGTTRLDENEDANVVRPGDQYKIYIGTDVNGSVAPELEQLVERGARLVMCSEEEVFEVMERYERAFLRWWKKCRGKGRVRK